MPNARALVLVVAAAVVGCAPAEWYDRCERDSDCDDGMVCRHTYDDDFCTIPCWSSSACRDQLGSRAYCAVAEICLAHCDRDADCPGDAVCDEDVGVCEVPE